LRVAGLGLYTLNGLLMSVTALLGGFAPAGVVTLALVLAVPVTATGLWFTDRANSRQAPHLHHRVRIRPLTLLWVLGVTALIYLLSGVSGLRNGEFAADVGLELLALQFVFIPVLLLAGTDFAEWSEVVSGRLSSLLERLGTYVPPAAVLLAAIGIFAYYTHGDGLQFGLNVSGAAEEMVPVAAIAVLVAIFGWTARRRRVSTRVPFWALVVGGLVAYGAFFGASVAGLGSTQPAAPSPGETRGLVTYEHPAEPVFSLRYPVEWKPAVLAGGVRFQGLDDGRLPVRFLVLHSGASGPALAGVLGSTAEVALGAPITTGEAEREGAWQRRSVDATLGGTALQGTAWSRQVGVDRWTLVGLAPALAGHAYDGLFGQVKGSWMPELPSSQTEDTTAGPAFLQYAVSVGVASAGLLLAGLLLLLRGTGERATAGLFLCLSGIFLAAGANGAGQLLQLLQAPSRLSIAMPNLIFGWAVGALLLVAFAALRGRLGTLVPVFRLVLILGLGFAGLEFLYEGVFGVALQAGARFSLLQGIVLLLAMLWDVLMSGESVTNGGGRQIPRHSRVLIYLGYTMMVATTVLFLSSLQVLGGGPAVSQFESDTWPQLGIAVLGPPLLLTFFLVNLVAWRRHAKPGPTDPLGAVDRSVLEGGERETRGGSAPDRRPAR
ncbi:MAG: hypothetical protein WAM30_02855, partial [Candidatus Dormiibacterota bacterium]